MVPTTEAVGFLQEQGTATIVFFEILAFSLLGEELLPLPRNPRISVIFGSSEKIHRIEAKQMANACLSANPYLVSRTVFSSAQSAFVYRRHEFLGKSLGSLYLWLLTSLEKCLSFYHLMVSLE